jgi:AcrR family transcriptional regulator
MSRKNPERSEATRQLLMDTAQNLFIQKGFANTGTPEIVSQAGVTRGALYHHFSDKKDLFHAILEREAKAVADDIESVTPPTLSTRDALIQGSFAYLDAMRVPGRTRLLLMEGPSVLGLATVTALDNANAARTLREGVEAALEETEQRDVSAQALSDLLSAAFDRAAIAIELGADPVAYRSTMIRLIDRALGFQN